MNAYLRFTGSILIILLAACAPAQAPATPTAASSETDMPADTLPPPTRTPLPSATALPPTHTPLPTASPTPERMIDPVTVPVCEEDRTGDTQAYTELLETLWPKLSEMDSYRYRTLYRYTSGNHYVDDELSVEVVGAYGDRLATPVESYITPYLLDWPLASEYYGRSQVAVTDLRTGRSTETIITGDGFWVRGTGDRGWIAFDPARPADTFTVAETFSPQIISLLIRFGAEAPAMKRSETLDGREVIHRCWVPSTGDIVGDYTINANMMHLGFSHVASYISDAELHLWTTKDDTQLVRLALTGKHPGETYGHYGDPVLHDTPSDFLLSMEISDVGVPADIVPTADQIALTIPAEAIPSAGISAPANDLPIPADAKLAGEFLGLSGENIYAFPREYWEEAGEIEYFTLNTYFWSGWPEIPADRRPAYETRLPLADTTAYYLTEMGRRGWQLKNKFFQAGRPVLYLFFERDEVTLPVILEDIATGGTRISAILPPSDELLAAINTGWTSYTAENSGLSSDRINAIAFDPQGRAWIGTREGLSVFDGEEWNTFSGKVLGLANEGPKYVISALAVDGQGRVWVGTYDGLAVFDGNIWKTYNSKNSKLPGDGISTLAVDSSGRIWMSLDESVSVFDGKTFTNYAPGEFGLPGGHSITAIASDPQSHIWIGNEGGGVYMFDGEAWKTILKAKSPPHVINSSVSVESLAIDRRGWVWIATGEGLSVFDGKDWITYTQENSGMPLQALNAVAVDASDRVWVGGNYEAVSVLETDGTWKDYTPVKDMNRGGSTNAMVVDRLGRIWVGTEAGLNLFTPPAPTAAVERVLLSPTPQPLTPTPMPTPSPGWTSYTTENSGLISNYVNAVAVDGQDQVWVGTGGGASVFSPTGEWTSYTLANSGLVDENINALAIDLQDRVWMGTGSGGLAALSPDGNWKTYAPYDSGLAYRSVAILLLDSQGRLWIANNDWGSVGALSVLDPDGKWSTYTEENSALVSESIEALAMDEQERVWIGTLLGVSILSPDSQWTNYTEADLGLTGEQVWVTALAVDEQGRVWIGSSNSGLTVIAPDGSRTAYTTANSDLLSDEISALHIDDQYRVWVGTAAGLSVLTPDGRWESYTPTNSGLIEGTISSLAVDRYGRVWVGTDAGLCVFVPNVP